MLKRAPARVAHSINSVNKTNQRKVPKMKVGPLQAEFSCEHLTKDEHLTKGKKIARIAHLARIAKNITVIEAFVLNKASVHENVFDNFEVFRTG